MLLFLKGFLHRVLLGDSALPDYWRAWFLQIEVQNGSA